MNKSHFCFPSIQLCFNMNYFECVHTITRPTKFTPEKSGAVCIFYLATPDQQLQSYMLPFLHNYLYAKKIQIIVSF